MARVESKRAYAGCGRAATSRCGAQADPAVTVPADVAALLLAHGLDPADPVLVRCVVAALGVTKTEVDFLPLTLALSPAISRGRFTYTLQINKPRTLLFDPYGPLCYLH